MAGVNETGGYRARTSERWSGVSVWLFIAPILGRLTLAVALAIVAMYCFINLAHEVRQGETRQFDVAVLEFFREHRRPWLFQFFTAVSWLGGPRVQPWVVAVSVLGLILARRFWPDGLTVLVAAVGGGVLMYGLKRMFQRPRPEVLFDHLGYSFPSGHSFFGLVVYCMVAYWLARDEPPRRQRWIWGVAIAGTLLMGFSRIYLGEHYPSDVAAAYAVGIPWVWGCLALPTALHRGGRDLSPRERRAHYQEGVARLRDAAAFLPQLAALNRRLLRDPRVPVSRRPALWALTGYLALPFDLIPDFIPVLGLTDDLIVVSLALGWVARSVTPDVVREHWNAEVDLFDLLERVQATARDAWKPAPIANR
jgi:undecaprenyl-diphosphatase